MQNSRFVVLTGHLRDYPLSDLVGILRHQRKTGRLTVEYPKGPGTFFFSDGELVDAQLSNLTGLKAVCVAVAQPEASFNFNPLIQSSRRTIAPSFQRLVSELFGCWDESVLQIEGTAVAGSSERSLPPAQIPSDTPQLISSERSLPPAQIPSDTPQFISSERSLPPAQIPSDTPQLISSERSLPPVQIPSDTPQLISSERSIEPDQILSDTPYLISSERSVEPDQTPWDTPRFISPGNPQPLDVLPAFHLGIQRRSILFFAAAAIVLIGLSTAIALSVRLNLARSFSEMTGASEEAPKQDQSQIQKPAISPRQTSKAARKSEQSRRQVTEASTLKPELKNQPDSSSEPLAQTASGSSSEPAGAPANSAASTQSIKIIMQVENGRVLKAAIANHKPGMDSYEGLALRIAKQRRYPVTVTGQESVQITVARPN